jgi:hypothetical protein
LVATRLACRLVGDTSADPWIDWTQAVVFGGLVIIAMVAMGLFTRRMRDRMAGVILRITLSVIVGGVLAGLFLGFFPAYKYSPLEFVSSIGFAWLLLVLVRAVAQRRIDEDIFKRRVLVYGAGNNAMRLAKLRRRADQRGFRLLGFVPAEGEDNIVAEDRLVRVNGGLAEVTAYGWGSEHCAIGWWSNDGVQVNCYADGGVPADSMFTLNFTDQSPIGTPSYQYVWPSDPWSSSYTPHTGYQHGAIASECLPDAGTVTIQRYGTGYYVADLPKISPDGSNVKVTAYGWAGETCKVGSWFGNGGTGTQVYVLCFDPSGNPVDAYFDLVYASRTFFIC